MDSGPIAGQVKFVIPDHSTSNTLFEELGNLAARQVPNWMIGLTQKDPKEMFKEQVHEEATFVKKLKKRTGESISKTGL